MAEEDYKTITIYKAKITLYNMLEFARKNDVLISNPCKKSLKSDMGKSMTFRSWVVDITGDEKHRETDLVADALKVV